MSARANDLVRSLERAAHSADDVTFDAAFEDLLGVARHAAEPGAELHALVAARLSGELVEAAGAMPRWMRWGQGLVLVGVGVAIAFVWGRAPQASPLPAQPAQQIVEAPAAVLPSNGVLEAVAVEPANPSSASPSSARSEVTERDVRAAASSRAAPTRPASAAAPARETAPDNLRFVLEQLRKAQLFLRAHEPARALAALDRLDARVPASLLSEERDVTRTLALCDSGDVAQARVIAERVLTREPDSAYAVSLRESCAGTGTLLEQMRERTSNPAR